MSLHILLLIIVIFLSGCALRYTDNDNNETIIGCVWMKQKAEDPVITQVRTIGLGFNFGSQDNGINLGYKDTIKITPRVENAEYFINYHSLDPFNAVVEEKIYRSKN